MQTLNATRKFPISNTEIVMYELYKGYRDCGSFKDGARNISGLKQNLKDWINGDEVERIVADLCEKGLFKLSPDYGWGPSVCKWSIDLDMLRQGYESTWKGMLKSGNGPNWYALDDSMSPMQKYEKFMSMGPIGHLAAAEQGEKDGIPKELVIKAYMEGLKDVIIPVPWRDDEGDERIIRLSEGQIELVEKVVGKLKELGAEDKAIDSIFLDRVDSMQRIVKRRRVALDSEESAMKAVTTVLNILRETPSSQMNSPSSTVA